MAYSSAVVSLHEMKKYKLKAISYEFFASSVHTGSPFPFPVALEACDSRFTCTLALGAIERCAPALNISDGAPTM